MGGEGGGFITAAKGVGQKNFNHVWGEGHFFHFNFQILGKKMLSSPYEISRKEYVSAA